MLRSLLGILLLVAGFWAGSCWQQERQVGSSRTPSGAGP
jgi:hypothetical protein